MSNDEHEFRLRPQAPKVKKQGKPARTWSAAFKTVMHYARASRRFGAGRGTGGGTPGRPFRQRCAVRVTYSPNRISGQWRAHGKYIGREGATQKQETVAGYVNTHCALDKLEFEQLCHDNLLVLIDIPNPAKKVGYDRPLGIVPELKEKSYYQHTRQATEDEEWRNIMTGSMSGIGPIRVLCHAEIRTVLGSVFAPIEGEQPSKGHRGVEVELAGILLEILGLYGR